MAATVSAQAPGRQPAPAAAADFEYVVTFNRVTAAASSFDVRTTFRADAPGPVELSLPAWTPGAYEISNFARQVSGFEARQNDRTLQWDKIDYDTWRVVAPAAGPVEIRFRFRADSLDNAMAWSRPDFGFANGTNLFLYPEGSDLSFPAAVRFETETDWQVATGMASAGPRRFTAPSYHDLVDMPFFVGRIDVDSAVIDGVWNRIASYPAGVFTGAGRQLLWDQLRTVVPTMSRVFGQTPWQHYTTLLIFDAGYGGGSALEHQNSHVGIYQPEFIGSPVLASITAHEIFHAWNVKRLRPAEMVPYRYDHAQPTTLLWVSEGITDYYADLALLRGAVIDSSIFLAVTAGKANEVSGVPPVALEDASLSTWIQPTDGTGTIYYPKGSLAGFLLDILIRDASDNRASLDDVMKSLYDASVAAGRGFTDADWWQHVQRAAGRDLRREVWGPYIDGREPFPWSRVAPLAGLRFEVDSVSEPRIGVGAATVDGGQVITNVAPGSAAAEAGLQPGDRLITIGDITVQEDFGTLFRERYRSRIGQRVPVTVDREGSRVETTLVVRAELLTQERFEFERRPSLKAARVRHGLFTGTTSR